MTKQWIIISPKVLPISFHFDRRVPAILLILTLVTLIAMILHDLNLSYRYVDYLVAVQ